ncbi:MAG TPA: M28 family peptidase [Pyrinomonadaceae bacterium]|jgi:Zn-dependent M28 family amino/carboxypeptidase
MKKLITLLLVLSFNFTIFGQSNYTSYFDAARIKERVRRLSADEFAGRSPSDVRAAQYIAEELKKAGAKPVNGSYFQNVKLFGTKTDPATKLNVAGKSGGSETYKFGDDWVGFTHAQKPAVSIDAEIVFMGYGIDAPLYNWNDYKGNAADYRGKVLMVLVNDPPATQAEPNLFGGKGLTYFGRWTYKFEEAARKGAAGVILVHTTESAGYGWNVVRSSNGGWRYEIARGANDKTPFLNLKSWATNEAATRMLKSANLDLERLKTRAQSRDFQPVKTGLKVNVNLQSETKTFDSPNVVGVVEGADQKLKNEYVVYTAHWDHLGVGEPDKSGDKIYNGAYDNASGVATVIGIAEVLAKMPQSQKPKRSFLFLFPTAEEQGLLGAEYYAQNPLVPLKQTVANVNIDGVNFFGQTMDFKPLGAERSALMTTINEVAQERNLTVERDDRPEQGFFYRSDHFPFAKVGVPAVSIQHGDAFVKPLAGEAEKFFKGYTANYYHQASDQFYDWWDATAMVQEAEYSLAIGMKIANASVLPRYNETDEFSAADKKRLNK